MFSVANPFSSYSVLSPTPSRGTLGRDVHAGSDNSVGYIHVPDMDEGGYADFHRLFLLESQRDALIVDVCAGVPLCHGDCVRAPLPWRG